MLEVVALQTELLETQSARARDYKLRTVRCVSPGEIKLISIRLLIDSSLGVV